jgi:hypothetical protein
LETFFTFADRLGEPKARICWLHNTTRCGSMLLCQVLGNAPGTVVLQEPDAITCALFGYWQQAPREKLVRLLRAIVRVMCCAGVWPNAEVVVIKPRGHCIVLMEAMAEAAPDSRHLFLYRNGAATVQSMMRAFGSEPADLKRRAFLQNHNRVLQRVLPSWWQPLIVTFALSNDPAMAWARNPAVFSALPLLVKYILLWGSICREYLKQTNGGVQVLFCLCGAMWCDVWFSQVVYPLRWWQCSTRMSWRPPSDQIRIYCCCLRPVESHLKLGRWLSTRQPVHPARTNMRTPFLVRNASHL